jgi:hypothetical protein
MSSRTCGLRLKKCVSCCAATLAAATLVSNEGGPKQTYRLALCGHDKARRLEHAQDEGLSYTPRAAWSFGFFGMSGLSQN